jgi:hypothetical protein
MIFFFLVIRKKASVPNSTVCILNQFLWYSVAELAASVPSTEMVGKSDYFRFGMRDSLAIEASFLQVVL